MGRLDRLREVQWAIRRAAVKRWNERAQERQKNLSDIAAGGIGAADSPMRNARFRIREAAFKQARELRSLGRLPFAIERKIGPTLDWTPFAPSDGARAAGRPVARVVELHGPGTQPEGFASSFLVTSRLLMTNHHVFPTKADTVGVGANFLYERTDRGIENGTIFEIDGDAFYLSDERLDFAIVGIKPRSLDGKPISDFGSVPLIEATPKILIGQRVNIIQYPEGGPKQYAVRQNRLVDLLDLGFLHYETDTLEGSSGSPAFSENWQLVGLHHASIPEMIGDKVVAVGGGFWDDSMPDDKVHWIANEGTRVSALVKQLGSVKMEDPKKQALLDELMASTTDPVDDLASELAKPEKKVLPPAEYYGAKGSINSFNFSGPVTIHVYAPADGGRQMGPVIDVKPPTAIAVEKVIRFDPDYKKREGYDPNFLDPNDSTFEVPVPTVSSLRQGELLKGSNGKPRVLKYHHYELVMNEDRRLQMWSAVNVDYDPNLKSKGDRKSFGSDKWIPDPRIPGELQIMDAEFYKPAGNVDRGHIVRREDNAWGQTDEEIEFANSDTFHWTNCTPQHEAFNQSEPGRNDSTYIGMKGLWGDFENHVQKNLTGKDTRACILAGPVLDDNDPSRDFGFGEIKYPLQFWKIIAVPVAQDGTRKLTVFGFVLSQRDVVKKFGIEIFRPGRFRKYQKSLATITEMTGVEFHKRLHDADVMAGSSDEIPIVDGNEIRGLRGGAPPRLSRSDSPRNGKAPAYAAPDQGARRPKAR
jgi:endonuclease G, mitochondrial